MGTWVTATSKPQQGYCNTHTTASILQHASHSKHTTTSKPQQAYCSKHITACTPQQAYCLLPHCATPLLPARRAAAAAAAARAGCSGSVTAHGHAACACGVIGGLSAAVLLGRLPGAREGRLSLLQNQLTWDLAGKMSANVSKVISPALATQSTCQPTGKTPVSACMTLLLCCCW